MSAPTRTLYLAGPMSGYDHFNYPAFFNAEAALGAAGYDVLNPARNPEQSSWDGYMRAAIAQLIRADGVAVLADWQMSAGACAGSAHRSRAPGASALFGPLGRPLGRGGRRVTAPRRLPLDARLCAWILGLALAALLVLAFGDALAGWAGVR